MGDRAAACLSVYAGADRKRLRFMRSQHSRKQKGAGIVPAPSFVFLVEALFTLRRWE
jgi:hypothetical protein